MQEKPSLPLELLASISVTKKVPKGKILFGEGDTPQGFWLLEEGGVRLYSMGENGREVEIHRIGAGQMIGTALALAQIPFPHFGIATENSRLRFYSTARAVPIIASHPSLAMAFLQILAGKCGELTARIAALQMQSVRERLLYYLGEECPKNAACSFRLPMPKKDLAQTLGTTPETLSRTFAQLQSEGVLKTKGRQVQILQCLRAGRCQAGLARNVKARR